jgi:preprotein translocase SecE subunit
VARDRKRSQGRRKRTPSSGGDPSRAKDMNIDDPAIDEAGATDDVAAPDPLKNSSAEVDQAKAAETGAVRGESGDVEMGEDAYDPGAEDFEHAPDELERDLGPETAGGRSLSGSVDPAVAQELQRPRKDRGKVITFLGHCIDELRRVQWPDRKQVGQATAVVLGFVVIAGSYLGLLDAIWKPLVKAII